MLLMLLLLMLQFCYPSIQEQISKVKFFKDQIGANSTDSSLNRAIQVLEQGKKDVLNL